MNHGHPECYVCNGPVPDYEPAYCCSGQECGCYGQPLEPPMCSSKCWDFAMVPFLKSEDGRSYETLPEKKIRLSFKDWKPNMVRFMGD